jgi:RNA polymerase sigma factor (sigma-70 family)
MHEDLTEKDRSEQTLLRHFIENLAFLRRYAFSLCRSHVDTDDILQDSFLRATRGWGKFNRWSTVRTWLSTIVYNTFVDHWRCKNRHKHVSLPCSDLFVQPSQDPLEQLESLDARALTLFALDRMPSYYWDILEAGKETRWCSKRMSDYLSRSVNWLYVHRTKFEDYFTSHATPELWKKSSLLSNLLTLHGPIFNEDSIEDVSHLSFLEYAREDPRTDENGDIPILETTRQRILLQFSRGADVRDLTDAQRTILIKSIAIGMAKDEKLLGHPTFATSKYARQWDRSLFRQLLDVQIDEKDLQKVLKTLFDISEATT